MILLATGATFFGFALGLRYTICVLILMMLVIGSAIVIFAFPMAIPFVNLVLTLALVFTCLQVGFVGGATCRRRHSLFGVPATSHPASQSGWPAR